MRCFTISYATAMSRGTVTPPCNQNRAGDDEAPVIALRRRGPWDVDERHPLPPAPQYTFFDAPDDPAPSLGERNIWDGRPIQLRLRQPQPMPSEVLERPREPAPQSPRGRFARPWLLAGAAALALLAAVAAIASLGGGLRSPSPGSVATDTNRHLCCGRNGRDSSFGAGARIQHSADRGPSATGSRALDARHARATARPSECARPAVAPRNRATDSGAWRECPELERFARARGRVEPEGQPGQTEELAPRCALVVRHQSEPVRARRPRVLS